ncbi:MAG: AI-2E family transporter [Eubacteriales bacterium]|nr:AI-2E family transporter [Eubacteriales bacterium]
MDEKKKSTSSHEQPVLEKTEKSSPPEKQKFIRNDKYFTISIYALIVVFISVLIIKAVISSSETIAALKGIMKVLMPFCIGILIAYVLNPLITKMEHFFYRKFKREKHGLSMVLSIAITYIVCLGLILLTLSYIIPQIINSITEIINYIPETYTALTSFLNNLNEHFPNLDLEFLNQAAQAIIPDLINYLRNFTAELVPTLYVLSVSIVQWLVNLLIAIIVSIYLLAGKNDLFRSMRYMMYAFIPQKKLTPCLTTLSECNKIFSNFVVGKFIDSSIIGVLCFILMNIFRLPYALLISAIVGVTNMIPYFGPFIGAIPGIVIILMISPLKALGFSVLILALQQFDGLILGPKILGDSTGLRPLWIIFAITVGGSFAGVLGMFLGVPTVAVIRYLFLGCIRRRLDRKQIPYDEQVLR